MWVGAAGRRCVALGLADTGVSSTTAITACTPKHQPGLDDLCRFAEAAQCKDRTRQVGMDRSRMGAKEQRHASTSRRRRPFIIR